MYSVQVLDEEGSEVQVFVGLALQGLQQVMVPRLSLALVDREGATPSPHGARRPGVVVFLAVVVIAGLVDAMYTAVCNPSPVKTVAHPAPIFLAYNVWP